MKHPVRLALLFLVILAGASCSHELPIDRKALVNRHQVINTSFDSLGSLTVGNGGFAFSVDFTGLQTFPEEYARGIPLGTMSDWGWHTFPNDSLYRLEETMEAYPVEEREITYSIQKKDSPRNRAASNYFRVNPHRLHLGIIGFNFKSESGEQVNISDISEIDQTLDLWKGEIHSCFRVMGEEVEVLTFCDPEKDALSIRVRSELISSGRLSIGIRYPYPSGNHSDAGSRWDLPDKHSSLYKHLENNSALIERVLDSTRYYTTLQWEGNLKIEKKGAHFFELSSDSNQLQFCADFTSQQKGKPGEIQDSFDESHRRSVRSWNEFWRSGGAVDFSGSTDPRAHELERRVVLSQYLTRVQCAGAQPPQETGLTYNSWYGKFHLEMAWWHMVHFFLWNRPELMEESLNWYQSVADKAQQTAMRQGYDGIRWQKMTEPSGYDSPSSTGSFLIWQQPHYIYFAELCYRQNPDTATLKRFRDLVFATADFMASYARYNPLKSRYELGPVLIPAQECFNPLTTLNPPFELSYWHWGLSTAISWAERLGEDADPYWIRVQQGLSRLHAEEGLYLPAENLPRAYLEETHMHDHPAVLGAFGILPDCPLFDKDSMQSTFNFVRDNWHWEETWGWDFPMTAMSAVRLGRPEEAMDALFMLPETNTYLANGHNYQNPTLRLYLPGNGGLLTAVAMMCAGYDGCTIENPGIPRNGMWKVRWEGLSPLP